MGISRAEALDSLRSDDLIGIGMEADAVRRRLHPEGVVSYSVVCRLRCAGADPAALATEAGQMLERGASGISLLGAAGLELEGVLRLVAELRRTARSAWIEGLSADEIGRLAADADQGVGDVIARLRDAGWDSLGSNGPELGTGPALAEWLAVQEAAHRAGVRTVATMRFGAGETVEERVGFLETVRGLQERTGGFAAFVSESAGGGLNGPTAVECLKTLAVSRLMLDCLENVQVGWMATGLKVLEMGLRFGANDAGEVVVGGSGAGVSSYEEDLRRVIRDAGFTPVERDSGYRMMFVA